ncbi:hypothetical protein BGZ73_000978, partial [Actinomortierella ambigua]
RSANIPVKNHVERGGLHVRIRSQYISTTRSPKIALSWLIREGRNGYEGSIAIISAQQLRSGISLVDLSEGYPTLEPYYDELVREHQEVLVSPIVNADAILGIVSYADIGGSWRQGLAEIDAITRHDYCTVRGYDESGFSNYLEWDATDEEIERYFSVYCSFCSKSGHDDDDCLVLKEWQATEKDVEQISSIPYSYDSEQELEESDGSVHMDLDTAEAIEQYYSIYCSFCRQSGHDDDDCFVQREQLATNEEVDPIDEANERYYSVYCSFCSKSGHDDDDCLVLKEWGATEEAVAQLNPVECAFCSEPGHEEADCAARKELDATEAVIEQFYSIYCTFCNEHGHEAADCPASREWDSLEKTVEQYLSVYCKFCSENGHDEANCSVLKEWNMTGRVIEQHYSNCGCD